MTTTPRAVLNADFYAALCGNPEATRRMNSRHKANRRAQAARERAAAARASRRSAVAA